MKNINDLMRDILELFPNALVDEDANGELIIYTGTKVGMADGR